MSTEEYSIGYADGKRDGYNEGVVDGHQAATSRQDAKIKALVEALTEITELDASDTEEGFNEWGEAFCFGEAKRIAGEALAVKETP